MVVGRIAKRYILQQLVKRGKPGFTKYVSQEYGQIAGSIAGIALSVGVGDYYGAITGVTGKFGAGPPDERNPPFGYLGEGLNGPPNGAFRKAHSTKVYSNRNRRNRSNIRDSEKCCCVKQKSSYRG